ncbi:type II toxin-antitoxin system HipA family toxin [Streptomyces somaliensis]|uniref:type II toxin-antitoxin system HipA family toxin n=1 Tax=Streptomyces somaliensis TaxID=78355 RepID=UPI0020CE9F36|nr:HipA domain-containing protein [Streptomyces somaliensis]MCP9943942.1 type II toxin-antitoxin system HipA family toxin [Streptomyces somaliensis]MCP9962813.1 type II toxin-antitoxin system HipA family toxin [Streptomyces somaliensis]MCP9975651.1 type II toxin-antitoxin system HipA family toxin [Streptomyces somaliensis]
MTALPETYYAVLLHSRRIGTLCQKGDYTRFVVNESYVTDPQRPVLGLRFEQNLRAPYASALRLPRWFSNLLPEGPLREWIADDRGVSLDREMELLAQVGHDLPGAVRVLPADGPDDDWEWPDGEQSGGEGRRPGGAYGFPSSDSPWRFSLAGVALKFSMLARGDRLTVPAAGVYGDWLVKFPDYRHPDVPRNEFTVMSLARAAGLDVPDVRLMHRDELEGLPDRMWPNDEQWAYAVRRFDRTMDEHRTPVHIEDFAQVRDKYPQDKYQSTFETVAAIAYRGHDTDSLREAARRIAFSVVVGNGDAHLKNWSLIYRDRRIPSLSPVYDLVSTVPYAPSDEPEDLGLKFGGSKSFERVRLTAFDRLEGALDRRFGTTDARLRREAVQTIERTRALWPQYEEHLGDNQRLRKTIGAWIMGSAQRLLRDT